MNFYFYNFILNKIEFKKKINYLNDFFPDLALLLPPFFPLFWNFWTRALRVLSFIIWSLFFNPTLKRLFLEPDPNDVDEDLRFESNFSVDVFWFENFPFLKFPACWSCLPPLLVLTSRPPFSFWENRLTPGRPLDLNLWLPKNFFSI